MGLVEETPSHLAFNTVVPTGLGGGTAGGPLATSPTNGIEITGRTKASELMKSRSAWTSLLNASAEPPTLFVTKTSGAMISTEPDATRSVRSSAILLGT